MTGDVVIEIPESFSGSWNDLTDKPFGEEGSGATIEWDGNTEGRDNFTVYGDGVSFTWYKVSDNIPSANDIVGGSFIVNGSTFAITDDSIITETGCYHCSESMIVVAQNTEISLMGVAISVPSTGIYFVIQNDMFVSSLAYGSSTIKTLDEKYIPDTIARVSDIPAFPEIPEINYPVTSVNGQTGDVVIEIPSTEGLATEEYVNSAITNINTYYTKAEIDNMEFITLDEIDAICARTIEVVTPTTGTF